MRYSYLFDVVFLLPWQAGVGMGCSRPGSKATLFVSCFMTQIRPTCGPLSSLFRLLCRWAKLLVRTTTCTLQVGTQSAKIWVLIVASPFPYSIITRFPVVKHQRFPHNPHGARLEWGSTLWGGGTRCHPWALFSFWRNRRLRGDLSMWYCAEQGWCLVHE